MEGERAFRTLLSYLLHKGGSVSPGPHAGHRPAYVSVALTSSVYSGKFGADRGVGKILI